MEAAELSRRLEEFYSVATEVLRDVSGITDQQVKHWIVNPFLVALGWDPVDKRQVYLDFPVKPDGHLDYALLDGQGEPRLVLQVGRPGGGTIDVEAAARRTRSVKAPLLLTTDGQEFSLYYIDTSGSPAPLFVLTLKELAENPEALVGLTVSYRLSDTGIHHLRKAAIRLAVIQMLEENSEKTFDAIVGWVSSQVAPGALDETTEAAIREATMLWLTEEYLALPGFAGGGDGHKASDLRSTSARDWEPFPGGPAGAFQYKFDTTKTLDLRQTPKEIRAALRLQGLRTPTATSFGGFYHALRHRAGLPTAK
ncbi:MAG: hypothetical protein L3K19_06475 [Thermoplasmata archaeon]|nr:hypothetical protein [Thermoplasmata archaeon]